MVRRVIRLVVGARAVVIQGRWSAIRGIQPHEWAVRFLFGGTICVLAGLISKKWGPGIGGLFLAFPAIFPAGACLLENHEKLHKARAGYDGSRRARVVAGVDAVGATLGCIGLAGFALTCWLLFPRVNAGAVLVLATLAWATLSAALWLIRKKRILHPLRRHRPHHVFRES